MTPATEPAVEAHSARIARFALLANALSGIRIELRSTRFPLAYSDGRAVYLPIAIGEQLTLSLIVQAALIRCGGLNPAAAMRLLARDEMTARYMTLEAARAAHAMPDLLPRRVRDLLLDRWRDAPPASFEQSLEWAASSRAICPAPEAFGTIRPGALLRTVGLRSGTGVESPSRTAKQRTRKDADEADEHESTERSFFLSRLSGPLPGETPANRFMKMLFGARHSASKDKNEGSGAELLTGSVRWAKEVTAAARIIRTRLGFDLSEEAMGSGSTYPEWDCEAGRYRRDWCRVSEYETADTSELHAGVADPMLRRKLARLSTSHVRHRHAADGDNLDSDALTAFIVDAASGYSGDERVYESRRKTGRSLSVLVLVDASQSTGDSLAGSTIWEAQQTLARSVIAALDDLGDCVAAYAFRSFGRNDVRFLRIKALNERFDQRARARLDGIQPAGYTRLGAAIRHAADRLSHKARTDHQLLVLVSDGLPFDMGYQDVHAGQDVRHALDEAQTQGIACVCLSVGSPQKAEALARVWDHVGHATLQTPKDLNRYAEPLFKAALARSTRGRSPRRPLA